MITALSLHNFMLGPLSAITIVLCVIGTVYFTAARFKRRLPFMPKFDTEKFIINYMIAFMFFSLCHELAGLTMMMVDTQPACNVSTVLMTIFHLVSWFPFLEVMRFRAEISCGLMLESFWLRVILKLSKLCVRVAYPILSIILTWCASGVVVYEPESDVKFCVMFLPEWILIATIGALLLMSTLFLICFLVPIINIFGKVDSGNISVAKRSIVRRNVTGYLISAVMTAVSMTAFGAIMRQDTANVRVLAAFMCTLDMGFNFVGFIIALQTAFSYEGSVKQPSAKSGTKTAATPLESI